VPLIRIVSLGMPLGDFAQMDWYILTAAPLFAAAVVAVRREVARTSEIDAPPRALRFFIGGFSATATVTCERRLRLKFARP